MSSQRKLNALLFELQTAQSPLAQAKILARSWRTLRELSATDRRLLARHAGFDGAEHVLEGLAGKKTGFAPATLLQVLNRARSTDGAAVNELLAAIRDPSRRDEAITRGAGLAAELLGESDRQEDPQEIIEALDQLHSVEPVETDTSEEVPAELDSLEAATPMPQAPPQPPPKKDLGAKTPESGARTSSEKPGPRPAAAGRESQTVPKAPQPGARTTPKRVAPMAGWDRLGGTHVRIQPEPETTRADEQPMVVPGSSRFDELAAFAALEAESSSLARLRVLDREMGGIQGASPGTIRELLEVFPEGWVRRRALTALITAGIPSSASQTLDLIAGLDHEVDRRWCLGAMARRGDLRGQLLERSLQLLESPAGRRRLQNIAARR